jgi:hypothetical protein
MPSTPMNIDRRREITPIFVANLSGSNFVSRLTDCRAGARSLSSG